MLILYSDRHNCRIFLLWKAFQTIVCHYRKSTYLCKSQNKGRKKFCHLKHWEAIENSRFGHNLIIKTCLFVSHINSYDCHILAEQFRLNLCDDSLYLNKWILILELNEYKRTIGSVYISVNSNANIDMSLSGVTMNSYYRTNFKLLYNIIV